MVKVITIIAKDHKRWVAVAKSFGLNEDAEDLVQDMYLKINDWKGKYDKTLMFNETEINHYFVFKVLRNLYLDKAKKNKNVVSLTNTFWEPSMSDMSIEQKQKLEIIKKEINSWHPYERRIYQLVFLDGISMLWLSDHSGIKYHTIRRTVLKIKKIINYKLKQ